MKYLGGQEIFLNGLTVHPGVIYLLSSGSTVRFPKGQPIYYSDISSHFLSARDKRKIILQAIDISYTFPSGIKGLRSLSFSAEQGNLVGILGSSGAGKNNPA